MRQRPLVLVADDLVDDPDPELRPALEPLVAGLAGKFERALEVIELEWVLLALGEEGRVQDPAALLEQPRLGPLQLPPGGLACLGGAREERLLVQEVGALERIVSQFEGLVPQPLSAQRACVVHAE